MHVSYHFCIDLKQSAQMQRAERVTGAVEKEAGVLASSHKALAKFSTYRIVTGDDSDQPCTRHTSKTVGLGSDGYASWAARATSTCARQTFELLH